MSRRSNIQRWAVSVLCGCVAWACMLGGIAAAELVDRIVAVINDDIILMSDLEQAMSGVRASLDKQGYSKMEQARILDEQRGKLLEKLIYDKLTDQQVARNKIRVKDDDVTAYIERVRAANKLSEEDLRSALELEGMTYEDYRNQVKEDLLRRRLVNREVSSKIVITDADVKAYYDANAEKYNVRTKYSLRHILLRVPGNAGQAEQDRVLENINAIRKRLDDGEDFAKVAELYSEAPTASQGGQLGVFASHLLTKEIAEALKGLKAKQYSQVVEMDQGYQLFFVEDIINAGGKGLEEAAPEIREKLYAEIVDKKFNEWIENLRKRSHIQILDK